MKKTVSFFLFLVLLCNATLLLAQAEPESIVPDDDKFQEYFYESLQQKGIENYDRAIIELENCLRLKPNEAAVYAEMGKNYFALKKYDQSYSSFEKAAQIDPKNKWYWAGMYEVNYKTKNFSQAIITVSKLVELDPKYKEDLMELYMNTQQFDKALVLIDELNENVGKSERRDAYKTQILSQGKFQNTAIDNLLEQISKNPKEESNYIALISLYSDKNESQKAIEITKKLEVAIPTSDWAQLGLFKYYVLNNDGQKAIIAMNIVLASSKIDAKIKHRVLNEFLIFVDKNPHYSPDLDKAITYFDNEYDVIVAKEIGKYYQNKKQWDKAIHYYEQALKNSPNEYMETNLLLLQSYVELKQFEIVAKKGGTLVEIHPTQPQFYYFSGLANNQMKQFKKAKEMLEMGMDYVVDNAVLEVNFNLQLGEAYNGLGDFKKKEQCFAKANQLVKDKK